MTLNSKIGGIIDFSPFRATTQVYIIHKVALRYYRYAIQIENSVFVYQLNVNTPIFKNYWTGTAIGFRASRELKFLVDFRVSVFNIPWKRPQAY